MEKHIRKNGEGNVGGKTLQFTIFLFCFIKRKVPAAQVDEANRH
jgi:hypothetical protein